MFLYKSNLFENRQSEYLSKYLANLLEQKIKQEEEQKQSIQNETSTANSNQKQSKAPSSPKQKPKSGKASLDVINAQQMEELNLFYATNFFASHIQSLMPKVLCTCSAELNKKQIFQQIYEFLNPNTVHRIKINQ